MLLADRGAARSIVSYKQDEDKILKLDSTKLLAQAGPIGDRNHFGEFVQKNIALYNLRTGLTLNTWATASWVRNQLAEALRKGPYQVSILLGGYDTQGDKKGPHLYYMDYLGSMVPVNTGAHGYASNFTYGILDRHWHENITVDEAKLLLQKCIDELHTRFLIHMPQFMVKIIDKNGIKEIQL